MKTLTTSLVLLVGIACSRGPHQVKAETRVLSKFEKKIIVSELLETHLEENPEFMGKDIFVSWGEEIALGVEQDIKSLGFGEVLKTQPENVDGIVNVESDWIVRENGILVRVVQNGAMTTVWSYMLVPTAPAWKITSNESVSSICSPGFEDLEPEDVN